jgi:capsular polysaccharide biosynthesis protein
VIENSFNKLNNKIKVSKPNELQIIPINLDHLAQSARVLYPKCVYSLWHNYAI